MTRTRPTPFPVPQFTAGRAGRDYAARATLESKPAIQRLIDGGMRRHADIATALNELGTPSPSGRPWNTGSVGRRLKRLGINGETTAQRDAEAVRDQVEDLWARYVRTPPQIAVALNLRSVPCVGGGQWTAGKVSTLLRRLGGEWMVEKNGRLRRGDDVPLEMERPDEPYEVVVTGDVADLGDALDMPAAPQVVEAADVIEAEALAEPREAAPRRRGLRV